MARICCFCLSKSQKVGRKRGLRQIMLTFILRNPFASVKLNCSWGARIGEKLKGRLLKKGSFDKRVRIGLSIPLPERHPPPPPQPDLKPLPQGHQWELPPLCEHYPLVSTRKAQHTRPGSPLLPGILLNLCLCNFSESSDWARSRMEESPQSKEGYESWDPADQLQESKAAPARKVKKRISRGVSEGSRPPKEVKNESRCCWPNNSKQ